MLVPVAGGTPKVVSTPAWMALTWASDSRRIYALGESETSGHFALSEVDVVSRNVKTLNPDLGPIPVANQPIRGFSYAKGQGFLTSLASARSDIWILEGLPRAGRLAKPAVPPRCHTLETPEKPQKLRCTSELESAGSNSRR